MTQTLPRLNDNKLNSRYLALPNCVNSLKAPALQVSASSINPNKSVSNILTCINM